MKPIYNKYKYDYAVYRIKPIIGLPFIAVTAVYDKTRKNSLETVPRRPVTL